MIDRLVSKEMAAKYLSSDIKVRPVKGVSTSVCSLGEYSSTRACIPYA